MQTLEQAGASHADPHAAGGLPQEEPREEARPEDRWARSPLLDPLPGPERHPRLALGSPEDSPRVQEPVAGAGRSAATWSTLRDLALINKWDGSPATVVGWLAMLDHTRQAMGLSVDNIVGYLPMLTCDRGRSVALGYTARYPQGPHRWKRLHDYFISVMGPAVAKNRWRELKMEPDETVGIFWGRFLQALKADNANPATPDRMYAFTKALLPRIRAHVQAVQPDTMDELMQEAELAERRLFFEEQEVTQGHPTLVAVPQSQRRCFVCDGKGHIARQCPSRTGQEVESHSRYTERPSGHRGRGRGGARGRGGRHRYGFGTSTPQEEGQPKQSMRENQYDHKGDSCQLCGRKGHIAMQCRKYTVRKKKPQERKDDSRGGQADQEEQHGSDAALAQLEISTLSDDEGDMPTELLSPRVGAEAPSHDSPTPPVIIASRATTAPTCRVTLLDDRGGPLTSIMAAVDTGAAVSLIKAAQVPQGSPIKLTAVTLRAADNSAIRPQGRVHVDFQLGHDQEGDTFAGDFLVLHECPYDMVLGMDFLNHHRAVLTTGPQPELTLIGRHRQLVQLNVPPLCPGVTRGGSHHLLLVAPLMIPGGHESIVETEVPHSELWSLRGQEGYIDPPHKQLPSVHVAYGVTQLSLAGKTKVLICNSNADCVTLPAGYPVAEFTPEAVEAVPARERDQQEEECRSAEADSSGVVAGITDSRNPLPVMAATTPDVAAGPPRLTPKVVVDPSLTPEQRRQLEHLLVSYADVFANPDRPPPSSNLTPYEIPLVPDAQPVRVPPRHRWSPAEARQVQEEVDRMLAGGVIRRSHSPWSSPIVLVRKQDNSLRFCVDFRKVNDLVVDDSWPIRRIDDIMDALQAPRYFSTLDLKSAFWTIRLAERSKEVTAFRTPQGHFEFEVLPFGLKTAPSAFQRCIDMVLLGMPTAYPYLDDIIVYSHTWQGHLEQLRELFTRLRSYGLQLNGAKCHLGAVKLHYLGHIIGREGIEVDTSKIKAIQDYPVPKNVSEVRGFLGVCGFIRRFIRDFACRARPLHALLKKDQSWQWTASQQRAFEDLRKAVTETTLLAHPDWDGPPFVLDVDSSKQGVGAVLSQRHRPICYWSRAFTATQSKYSAQELELLGVLLAVIHFRPYCFGRRFILRCDHKNLKSILYKESRTGRVERWSEALAAYDFDLEYRPADKMKHVDALSRAPTGPPAHEPPSGAPVLVTTRSRARAVDDRKEDQGLPEVPSVKDSQLPPDPHPHRPPSSEDGFDALRDFLKLDPVTHAIIAFLKDGSLPDDPELRRSVSSILHSHKFAVDAGVLYKIDQDHRLLVIPKQLRHQVLLAAHGHRGRRKTIGVLRSRVWWPRLYHDVSVWTRCCHVCQRNKPLPRHGALHHASPLGTLPFRRICADVTGPLAPIPTPSGFTHLLVVVCMATRWVEAYPLKSPGNHFEISVHLMDWFSHYGVPERVHSDQGSPFMAHALSDAYKRLGIKRSRTTPYHPQGDPAERMIGSVKKILRALSADSPETWDRLLPVALMALRAQQVDTLGLSPFEALHGAPMRVPFDEIWHTEPNPRPTPLHGLAQRLQRLRERIAKTEEYARSRYKHQHDKKYADVSFQVGEEVWLHYPNAHSPDKSQKLSLKWRGPFKIVRRIEGSKVYVIADAFNRDLQTVNVARIKKLHNLPKDLLPEPQRRGAGPRAPSSAPTAVDDASARTGTQAPAPDAPEYEVDCLRGRRRRGSVTYYLVQWAGVDPETQEPYAASWQPSEFISQPLIDEYEELVRGFRR